MNITAEKIRAITPGKPKPFPTPEKRMHRSLLSMITYVKDMGLPEGIKNYTAWRDPETNISVVTAIPE